MEQSIYYWILDIGIMYRKGGGRSGFWRIGERKELLREVDFWLSVLDMIAEERKGIDCSKQFWKEFTALCKRGNCPNYQRILQKKEDISNCKDIFMPDKEHEAKIHQLLQYFLLEVQKSLHDFDGKARAYKLLYGIHNLPKAMHGKWVLGEYYPNLSYYDALCYSESFIKKYGRLE